MQLTHLSYLKTFLAEHDLEAKKGFSQNFLIEDHAVKCMLKTADIVPNDLVLEVGPGPGAVTQQLLQQGARVIAVEKDHRFAQLLPRLGGELTVVEQDILDFDVSALTTFKIVASLPYHLTTEILRKFLPHPQLQSLTALVQKEAALRFLARPGTKAYNAFTVFLAYYGAVRLIKTVGRKSFYPPPHVDSAIIYFIPRARPGVDEATFHKVVQMAFTKRRKMLRQIFLEKDLLKAGILPTARPETLSLEDFVKLAREVLL